MSFSSLVAFQMDSRAAPWRPFEGLCSIQVLLEDCRSEAPGTVLLESLLWLTREYRDFFCRSGCARRMEFGPALSLASCGHGSLYTQPQFFFCRMRILPLSEGFEEPEMWPHQAVRHTSYKHRLWNRTV